MTIIYIILAIVGYFISGFITSFIFKKYSRYHYLCEGEVGSFSFFGPFGLVFALYFYFFCALPAKLTEDK